MGSCLMTPSESESGRRSDAMVRGLDDTRHRMHAGQPLTPIMARAGVDRDYAAGVLAALLDEGSPGRLGASYRVYYEAARIAACEGVDTFLGPASAADFRHGVRGVRFYCLGRTVEYAEVCRLLGRPDLVTNWE
jgi:hypothetical protein